MHDILPSPLCMALFLIPFGHQCVFLFFVSVPVSVCLCLCLYVLVRMCGCLWVGVLGYLVVSVSSPVSCWLICESTTSAMDLKLSPFPGTSGRLWGRSGASFLEGSGISYSPTRNTIFAVSDTGIVLEADVVTGNRVNWSVFGTIETTQPSQFLSQTRML